MVRDETINTQDHNRTFTPIENLHGRESPGSCNYTIIAKEIWGSPGRYRRRVIKDTQTDKIITGGSR